VDLAKEKFALSNAFTVIVADELFFAQPLVAVYVSVYVFVEVGETVMDDVVAPPGAQEYVPPAGLTDVFRVVDPPLQMDAEVGVTVTVGSGLTKIVDVSVLAQVVPNV
jgi:hypothetical protein